MREAVRCARRAETARAYFLHVEFENLGAFEEVGSVASRSARLGDAVEEGREKESSSVSNSSREGRMSLSGSR